MLLPTAENQSISTDMPCKINQLYSKFRGWHNEVICLFGFCFLISWPLNKEFNLWILPSVLKEDVMKRLPEQWKTIMQTWACMYQILQHSTEKVTTTCSLWSGSQRYCGWSYKKSLIWTDRIVSHCCAASSNTTALIRAYTHSSLVAESPKIAKCTTHLREGDIGNQLHQPDAQHESKLCP